MFISQKTHTITIIESFKLLLLKWFKFWQVQICLYFFRLLVMHDRTQTGLFVRNLWLIHPHCSHQYQCSVSSTLSAIVGFSTCPADPCAFFSTVIKQQPIVRGGACRRDRGWKLMKLFDGSPSRGAKGEPERTSAWQPDGWVKRGEEERNGQGDGNGGRCQTAVMT